MDIAYSFAGLGVGFIVGLTGVGGGSLMTPLLVLLFGITPSIAVGTDLLYASITKAGGTVVHNLKNTIEWKIVGWMALGSIPAALAVVVFLPGRKALSTSQEQLFSFSLGVMLLLTALSLLFRKSIRAWAARHGNEAPAMAGVRSGAETETKADARWKKPFYTVLTGAFIGVAVSLSSVGAGAVGVTALVLLYPKLAAAKIVGTDIVHAVPLTLVAGLGHASLGHIDWSLLGALLIGSLPGVALGSMLSTRLPDIFVRNSLVVLLLLIGGRLVFIR